MIKFRSKFQFQILLQFYRAAEKATKIKLVMVMINSFDKYHHLFNLHISVTILVPPDKPDHCPTANFRLLSRGSFTSLVLITEFNDYLTTRSKGT